METTTTINTTTAPRQVSGVYALAIVGFIALICAGMYLAVYSARFVPSAISSLSSAAVALSGIFVPANDGGLSVVPGGVSTTTIPFGGDGQEDATTTVPTTPNIGGTTVTPVRPGTETSGTYPLGNTGGGSVQLSGLPDLATTITAVGYLTTNSPDSFVAATVVPLGMRPAVKFTVKNVGTNIAPQWRFSAVIPTQTQFVYQSLSQQQLNPGESIDYTLGFDQATAGTNQQITISVNSDHLYSESNTLNNNVTATVTVLGS